MAKILKSVIEHPLITKLVNFVKTHKWFDVLYVITTILWCWDNISRETTITGAIESCLAALVGISIFFFGIVGFWKFYQIAKDDAEASTIKAHWLCLSFCWVCICMIVGNTLDCLHQLYSPIPSLRGDWFGIFATAPLACAIVILILSSIMYWITRKK